MSSANGLALQKRTDPIIATAPLTTKLQSFMTFRNSFDTDLNTISSIYLTDNTVAAKKTQISPYLTSLGNYQTEMNARIQEVISYIGTALPSTTITTIRTMFASSRPIVPDYGTYLTGTSFIAATANLTRAFQVLDAMDAEYAIKNGSNTNVQTFYNTFTEVTVPATTASSLQSSMFTSSELVSELDQYDYDSVLLTTYNEMRALFEMEKYMK